MTHSQGQLWLVNLDPTIGSEIRKTRPAVIVSPDELNEHLRTVIVVPLTTVTLSPVTACTAGVCVTTGGTLAPKPAGVTWGVVWIVIRNAP